MVCPFSEYITPRSVRVAINRLCRTPHVRLEACPVYPDRTAHPPVLYLSGTNELPERRPREPHELFGLLVGQPVPDYLRLHPSSCRRRSFLLASIVHGR